MMFADMHCDTLERTALVGPGELVCGSGMQDFRYMKETDQLLQFFAVFFPPKDELSGMKDAEGRNFNDESYYLQLRDTLFSAVRDHDDIVRFAKTSAQVRENRKAGRASAMLTIEDGRIVNGSMERLAALRDDGVCAIALTWNGENCFGYPNSKDPEVMNKGLTDFGREAVGEMNRLGILIDVSHLSDGGFYDAAALSSKPFAATHSNCREISNHPRNLTDPMIRALAEHGGIAGLNFYPGFVAPGTCADPGTTIEGLTEHVFHMLRVGGEDVIALGTDFDGIEGRLEIPNMGGIGRLFDALRARGLTERQMDKFMYGNVMRVLDCM